MAKKNKKKSIAMRLLRYWNKLLVQRKRFVEIIICYYHLSVTVCPSASTFTVAFFDRFSPKLAQT